MDWAQIQTKQYESVGVSFSFSWWSFVKRNRPKLLDHSVRADGLVYNCFGSVNIIIRIYFGSVKSRLAAAKGQTKLKPP